MRNVILSRNISRKNVRGIMEQMEQNLFLIRSKKGRILNNVSYTPEIVIRWGCTTTFNSNIEYNNAEAISKASNKPLARKIFKKNNIPIPATYTIEDLKYTIPDIPLIGRKKRHWGGKNLYFCETDLDIINAITKGAVYFSEFYQKTKEYRVHVAHGKCLIVYEKTASDENEIAWNLQVDDENTFKAIRWSEINPEIAKLGIDSINILGLDYGAVDILAEPSNEHEHKAVVSEVNTAPKLKEYGATRYAEYFDWLLNKEEKREHIQTTYDNWKGYVWTRNELKEGSDE